MRSSGGSEASFSRLTESSRLARVWNLALVFASGAAIVLSGQPWPLRLYLLVFVVCLLERVPPATCGLLSIDAHGHVMAVGDRQQAAGQLQAATLTALWIELRLARIAAGPVIWRDQIGSADWAMLRRQLLARRIGGLRPGHPSALRVSDSDRRRAGRPKLP